MGKRILAVMMALIVVTICLGINGNKASASTNYSFVSSVESNYMTIHTNLGVGSQSVNEVDFYVNGVFKTSETASWYVPTTFDTTLDGLNPDTDYTITAQYLDVVGNVKFTETLGTFHSLSTAESDNAFAQAGDVEQTTAAINLDNGQYNELISPTFKLYMDGDTVGQVLDSTRISYQSSGNYAGDYLITGLQPNQYYRLNVTATAGDSSTITDDINFQTLPTYTDNGATTGQYSPQVTWTAGLYNDSYDWTVYNYPSDNYISPSHFISKYGSAYNTTTYTQKTPTVYNGAIHFQWIVTHSFGFMRAFTNHLGGSGVAITCYESDGGSPGNGDDYVTSWWLPTEDILDYGYINLRVNNPTNWNDGSNGEAEFYLVVTSYENFYGTINFTPEYANH